MTTENKIDISKLLNEKLQAGAFDCSQCKSLIFNFLDAPDTFRATQCSNGCLFCRECASKTKSIGVCLKCKADANILSRNVSLELVFKDKRINCPNSLKETKAGYIKDKTGCQESVLIGDLYNHMTNCGFLLLDCASGNEKCSTKIRRNKMDEHLGKCAYSLVNCPNKCGQSVGKKLMTKHLNSECSQRESKCSKCEKMVIKSDESNHLLNACPSTTIECRYKLGGCNKKFKRGDLNTHLESENHHIAFIDKIINDSNAELKAAMNKIQELNETIEIMKGNDYQYLPDIDENELNRKRQRLPTNNNSNNQNIIQTSPTPLNHHHHHQQQQQQQQQQQVLTRPSGFYFNPNEK